MYLLKQLSLQGFIRLADCRHHHPHAAGLADLPPAISRNAQSLQHPLQRLAFPPQVPPHMHLEPAARHRDPEPLVAQAAGDLAVHDPSVDHEAIEAVEQ